MTSLLSARRRAEEFAAVVDGHPRVAEPSPQVAELLGTVATLRGHEQVRPRPEFAADLRGRLMAEAATVLNPVNASLTLPVRQRGLRERRLVAAASAFVLIGGTAGMAAAAQSALPGQALYPVKRGIEQAQTGLSFSDAGKGHDLLNQANDRLEEVQLLLANGSGEPEVPATIDDFTVAANRGADLLMSSFQDNRDPATIVSLREFSAHGITQLSQLAHSAPPQVEDELAAAAVALTEIDARASSLCQSCASGLPSLQVPRILLTAADVQRALVNGRSADLDNSHPVVVDRRAVEQATGTSGGAASTAGAQPTAPAPNAAPDGSGTSGPALQLPSKEQVQKGQTDLGNLLGGTLNGTVGGTTGGTTGGTGGDTAGGTTGGTVGGTVGGLTDGLGGTLETLLPAPTQSPNLLP
jgi:hypothetical protein